MDGTTSGIIGAVVGCLLGIIGGAVGTWRSIREAQSSAERRYIVIWAAGCLAGVATFLVSLAWLPEPYRWWAFVPYTLAAAWGIRKYNADVTRLRAADDRRTD